MKYSEHMIRSLTKTISWRVLLTMSHIINGFLVTGSLLVGLQIAGIAAVINSTMYWIHERVWNRLEWNRKHNDTRKFVEGQPRSVSKVITWRIVVTGTNFLIPFFLTGSWGQAALYTGVATLVNMSLYWAHERAWNIFAWGKHENTTSMVASQ